jgi:hypothetical protein
MTPTRILTSITFVAAFAIAVPAYAGQRHGGGASRSAGHSRGAVASRGGVVVSRGAHSYPVYRGGAYRGGAVVHGNVYVAPRIVGSRGYGHVAFYRPYYAFRPRLSLGFGLWAGYPVAYPYYSAYPYGYATPYPVDPYAYGSPAPSYGYPAQPYPPSQSPAYPPTYDPSGAYGSSGQGYPTPQSAPSVGVQRGGQQSASGGVSFEITPDAAAVFVDGSYVGRAATFGPTSEPLGLTPGRHHIELQAPGYRTMTFEADVTPGQVLPYQGTLQRD